MTVTLNNAKEEQPIGMINKPWENRCFHDHNRWESGRKCQIAIYSSFLFTVPTGPHRVHHLHSPLPSPKATIQSDHHTHPPAMQLDHILTIAIFFLHTHPLTSLECHNPENHIQTYITVKISNHISSTYFLCKTEKSNFPPSHCRSYDPTNWTECQYKTTLNM